MISPEEPPHVPAMRRRAGSPRPATAGNNRLVCHACPIISAAPEFKDVTCMTAGIIGRTGIVLSRCRPGVFIVKEVIRSVLRRLGLDVRRYSFTNSPDDQFRSMLARHRI